jgi:hypothetical protein
MGSHHPAEYFAESINPTRVIVQGPGYTAPDELSKMPSYADSMALKQLGRAVSVVRGGDRELLRRKGIPSRWKRTLRGLKLPFHSRGQVLEFRCERNCTFKNWHFSRVLNTPQVADNAGESAARLEHGFESWWSQPISLALSRQSSSSNIVVTSHSGVQRLATRNRAVGTVT